MSAGDDKSTWWF